MVPVTIQCLTGHWKPSNIAMSVFIRKNFSLPYDLSGSVGRHCIMFLLSFGMSFAGFIQTGYPRSVFGPLLNVLLTSCAFTCDGIFVFNPVIVFCQAHAMLEICFQVYLLSSLDWKSFWTILISIIIICRRVRVSAHKPRMLASLVKS